MTAAGPPAPAPPSTDAGGTGRDSTHPPTGVAALGPRPAPDTTTAESDDEQPEGHGDRAALPRDDGNGDGTSSVGTSDGGHDEASPTTPGALDSPAVEAGDPAADKSARTTAEDGDTAADAPEDSGDRPEGPRTDDAAAADDEALVDGEAEAPEPGAERPSRLRGRLRSLLSISGDTPDNDPARYAVADSAARGGRAPRTVVTAVASEVASGPVPVPETAPIAPSAQPAAEPRAAAAATGDGPAEEDTARHHRDATGKADTTGNAGAADAGAAPAGPSPEPAPTGADGEPAVRSGSEAAGPAAPFRSAPRPAGATASRTLDASHARPRTTAGESNTAAEDTAAGQAPGRSAPAVPGADPDAPDAPAPDASEDATGGPVSTASARTAADAEQPAARTAAHPVGATASRTLDTARARAEAAEDEVAAPTAPQPAAPEARTATAPPALRDGDTAAADDGQPAARTAAQPVGATASRALHAARAQAEAAEPTGEEAAGAEVADVASAEPTGPAASRAEAAAPRHIAPPLGSSAGAPAPGAVFMVPAPPAVPPVVHLGGSAAVPAPGTVFPLLAFPPLPGSSAGRPAGATVFVLPPFPPLTAAPTPGASAAAPAPGAVFAVPAFPPVPGCSPARPASGRVHALSLAPDAPPTSDAAAMTNGAGGTDGTAPEDGRPAEHSGAAPATNDAVSNDAVSTPRWSEDRTADAPVPVAASASASASASVTGEDAPQLALFELPDTPAPAAGDSSALSRPETDRASAGDLAGVASSHAGEVPPLPAAPQPWGTGATPMPLPMGAFPLVTRVSARAAGAAAAAGQPATAPGTAEGAAAEHRAAAEPPPEGSAAPIGPHGAEDAGAPDRADRTADGDITGQDGTDQGSGDLDGSDGDHRAADLSTAAHAEATPADDAADSEAAPDASADAPSPDPDDPDDPTGATGPSAPRRGRAKHAARRRVRVPAPVRRVAGLPGQGVRQLRRFPWQKCRAAARWAAGGAYDVEQDRNRTRPQRLAPRSRRMEGAAVVGSVMLCLLVGAMAPGSEKHGDEARASAGAQAPAPDAGAEGSGEALARSEPTRIRVPHIGIDVEVFGADLDPDGGPPTPAEEDAMRAAWYAGGVSPGENGASLIVGHLDTMTGPAAFAGLGMLEPGGRIEVDREDGTTAVFTVESVEQYPKQDFPNDRVYGATDDAQLRLITCGGRWTSDGGYDANIVAYARLGDGTAAPGDGGNDTGAGAGAGDAEETGADPEFPYHPFVPEGERGDHAPAGPGGGDAARFGGVSLLETLDGMTSLADLPGFDVARWTGGAAAPVDPPGSGGEPVEPFDEFNDITGNDTGDGFGAGVGQVEPFVAEALPGDLFGPPAGGEFSEPDPGLPPGDSGEPAPGW